MHKSTFCVVSSKSDRHNLCIAILVEAKIC